MIGTGLKPSTVISGGIPVAAFSSVGGLLVYIALSGNSQIFCLAIANALKYFKLFTIKQEKHDANKLVA